jgi:hypothetical protein
LKRLFNWSDKLEAEVELIMLLVLSVLGVLNSPSIKGQPTAS